MKRTFWKLIAAAILTLFGTGIVVGQTVTPASAYLTQCSVTRTSPSGGQSLCWSHANNGGLNRQRATVQCYVQPPHSAWATFYGPWVGEATYSPVTCAGKYINGYPVDPSISILSYQLR